MSICKFYDLGNRFFSTRHACFRANFLQILNESKSEWVYIGIALCAGIIQGCVMPAFAFFYGEIFNVSFAKLVVVSGSFAKSFRSVSNSVSTCDFRPKGRKFDSFWRPR